MILNNLKKVLWAGQRWVAQQSTYVKHYNGTVQGYTDSGSISVNLFQKYNKDFNNVDVNLSDGTIGMFLGTGTGEVTENDYCMFEIFTDYASQSVSIVDCITQSDVDSSDITVLTKTIKNTSGSTVTITELGLCGCYYTAYTLLTHDLLDNPVTLEPDDMYTFTLRIKL